MEKDNAENSLRGQYVARINCAIDFIETNIHRELSLETLAGVAGFSRFYFHRIFKALVGETLNQFIQRVRVEKAAVLLISNPQKSITEIALDCGFSGSATFARTFKKAFGLSASQWRSGGYRRGGKISKINSKAGQGHGKNGKEFAVSSSYHIGSATTYQTRRMTSMADKQPVKVEVKQIPEFHVAYVRHIGPYQGNVELFENLFGRLMKWAGPRELLRFPETKVLVIYHDNPDITDENSLRTSACITVPKDTPVSGEIGKMAVPGGRYASARFEINTDDFQAAWDTVFSGWLPESGYQPDDRPCFELCHNDYKEHPEKKHILDICVPVKPL